MNKEKSPELSETTGFSYIIYLNIKRVINELTQLTDCLEMIKPWEKKD